MLIAQITDMHLGWKHRLGGEEIDSHARLARAVAHLNGLDPGPDFVIGTGDLTLDGRPEEYAALKAALDGLAMPYSLIPGNHDLREPMRAAFPDLAWSEPDDGFLHHVVELGPLRLIALDTLDPGEHGGALCDARLAWLAARLEEQTEVPTVIAMHHPPLAVGIPLFDGMACRDGPALGGLLAMRDNVEAVICGHVHRAISLRWSGTVVHVTPSPSYQYNLAMREDERLTPVDEPAACRLLLWLPESGLVSHLTTIG